MVLLRITLSIALVLGMTACAERSMDDLRRFTETAYRDRKPDIEPLPRILPHESFVYTASKLTDPFSSANLQERKSEGKATAGGPDLTRRREPLEQYPLDALRMVGTLFRDQSAWVILRAPDGTIHRAKEGNYVGQSYGVITDIAEEKVSVKELVQGPNGNWIERGATIALGVN